MQQPALDALRDRPATFLFLQGIATPFFSDLGRALRARGHAVRRINLCPGDWLFWRGEADNYRGRREAWGEYLEAYLTREGITDIVLFGDSHADHWSTPLVEAASRNGAKVVTYLKASCRASRLPTFSTVLKRDYIECDAWREQAIAEIIRRKPRLVVISEFSIGNLTRDMPPASRAAETARWQAGLRSTLQSFSEAGVETAVIRDTPISDSFADSCVARALWWREPPSRCDTPRAQAANDSAAAQERAVVKSVPDTRYIDLTDRFCSPTECHVFISGKLAFRDRHHLATAFAETLEGPLEKALF